MSVTRFLRLISAPSRRAPTAMVLVAAEGSVHPSPGVHIPIFTSGFTSRRGATSVISAGLRRWLSTPIDSSIPFT